MKGARLLEREATWFVVKAVLLERRELCCGRWPWSASEEFSLSDHEGSGVRVSSVIARSSWMNRRTGFTSGMFFSSLSVIARNSWMNHRGLMATVRVGLMRRSVAAG